MRKLFYLFIIQFLFLQGTVFGQMYFTAALQDDNVTYLVKVRPETTFTGVLGTTNSLQLTLVVPAGGFEVDSIKNFNGAWDDANSILAPKSYPQNDYLVFNLQEPFTIDYIQGEEYDLFSFKNAGECTGTLDFMTTDDPFYQIALDDQIAIGNQAIVWGAGPVDAFSGTYGPEANCLMSQSGNVSCEVLDSVITTNPRECGLVGGTITIYAQPENNIPLRYSLDDGATFQSSNVFTDLASATGYALVVADEFGFCFKEHGVYELGPPSDAVIIRTHSTADTCEMTNGTITIEATPILVGSILEYSIDVGVSWHENNGFFTGVAAGNYLPRVRLKDASCHDETEEVVVAAACPDGGGGTTECIFTYILEVDNGVFTVSVLPDRTIPAPNENLTSTAQVVLKVPTGSFELSNFQSLIDGVSWRNPEMTIAPSEAPNFDYFAIALSRFTSNINYVAGEKTVLFSFENAGTCTGNQAFLMENYTDPFFAGDGVENSEQENTNQSLTVFAVGTGLDFICVNSNNISDCGVTLGDGGNMINYPTDTIYITLPVGETTAVCIGDELEISPENIGTVALCSSEGSVTTNLTDGSNCLDITTDDHFNQTETICIVHFDVNNNSISDTTILILCPEVELGPDLIVCAGETITLNALGGTGNFQWITDGNISCTDCANPQISPDGPTQYILISSENDHCMDSDTIMVDTAGIPNIDKVAAGQLTNCENNGQILITASGGEGPLKYSIDGGTTFQDVSVFEGLATGTYNVVVANQDESCSTTWPQSITLMMTGVPSITGVEVQAPNECRNEKGTISVTVDGVNEGEIVEYSIDGGTTWQDNGTFTDVAEGTYNLVVRIQGGQCEATYENNPIEVSQAADLRITTPPGDKIICSEGDRTIQLELSEAISNHNISGGPFTNEVSEGNILTFEANPEVDGSLYSVTLTGESGCSITEEFTLTPGEDTELWNTDIISIPASCEGNDGGFEVTVNENNNGFTFCWEPNKASGPTRDGLSADSTYSLTITGASGCTVVYENMQTGTTCEVAACNIFTGLDTLNAFVVENQATACIPISNMDLSEFQFYIGDQLQTMQFGECMQTSVFYSYDVLLELGDAPFTLVSWSVNNDTLRNFEFNTIEELVIQMNQFDFQANWVLNESLKAIQGFSTANVYGTLNVQPTDSNQLPELELITMNTMFQSIILDGTRGTTKYTLRDPLNDCEDQLYIKVQGLNDGMDTLELVTIVNTPISNQCLSTEETGTQNLTLQVCEGSEPSAGILSGITDENEDACFSYMPNSDFIGKDFFCLELCNGEICDTTIIRVTVEEEGLLFYTGFSPNDDGINDIFTIKNIESYPDNNVIIYNRWGNRIFQKESYINDEGWDGTYSEKISPDGVYFYLVKINVNGENQIFSGPITISR